MSDDTTRDVIDQARDDARLLIQARRLPVDQPLTDELIEAIRMDLRVYLERHKITIKQASKEAGVSQSVISQFLSGTYEGDVEKTARVLNDWMEANARKRVAKVDGGYIKTQVAESMRAIILKACEQTTMAAIVAPSGTGKTMLMKFMAEKTRGFYIYCDEDLTATAFLRELAGIVAMTRSRAAKVAKRTKPELVSYIVDALAGTGRPIFLDEAHRFPRDVISRVRTIHDRAEVPIIMAGAAEILDRINDRSDGHGQFASRCLQYNVLEHCINAEGPDGGRTGRPLFSKQEIAAFFAQLDVKLDRDAFEMAWAIACLPNHGCLRTVTNVVKLIRPKASSRGKVVQRDEIRRALALLFGQTGNMIAKVAARHIERTREAA